MVPTINAPINLDDGIAEYLEFIVCGIPYRMRYLTTEELTMLTKIKEEAEASKFLQEFVSPINAKDPKFEDTYQKMTIPQLRNFMRMVQDSFSLEVDGQSSNT